MYERPGRKSVLRTPGTGAVLTPAKAWLMLELLRMILHYIINIGSTGDRVDK